MMTNEEYVAKKGVRCPNCNSGDIEGGPLTVGEPNANECWQEVSCLNCNSVWHDVYTLDRFIVVEIGNGS